MRQEQAAGKGDLVCVAVGERTAGDAIIHAVCRRRLSSRNGDSRILRAPCVDPQSRPSKHRSELKKVAAAAWCGAAGLSVKRSPERADVDPHARRPRAQPRAPGAAAPRRCEGAAAFAGNVAEFFDRNPDPPRFVRWPLPGARAWQHGPRVHQSTASTPSRAAEAAELRRLCALFGSVSSLPAPQSALMRRSVC